MLFSLGGGRARAATLPNPLFGSRRSSVPRTGETPPARVRRLALAAVAATVTTATVSSGWLGVGPAHADDVALPTALPDSFYSQPADIATHRDGDILAVRPRTTPPGFFDVRTYQLKFRSSDSQGKPIAAVTTLLVPIHKQVNGPLLSFQHIINAVGLECAPSQALWTTDPNLTIREAPGLNGALQRGWTVSIPDHLGPRSAYGAARLGGQIALDATRAVQRFAPAQVARSKVAMAGYSGGGMATAWAAALAPTYAPELNIVGAAYGGVPMDLIKMAEGLGYNNPHPAFGLAFAAAIGLSREYPQQIPMMKFLSPLGKQMYSEMRNACTNDILRLGAGHSAKQVSVGGEQIFEDPTARRVVQDNSLAFYPGVAKTPIFEWHSPTDVLIPVASIDQTMRRYCRAGTRVQQFSTPSPDHMSAAVIGLLPAFDYLGDRFAGLPAPSTC
ncbi:putative secretory lipase [Gordonia polyisoprenivorans VH2]|uniref:Putative secretory lipase n=1 Tax=Gordonia polyisoprenivorans (strain DSM 44266 / VH2) TaxID=1112204 RepID=H6MX60_GORPV|nr:lipase family protein [Gordonia polyisoprenivorans]AFA72982.1 putative secretory lipase [Gordonia polyisoprenivorans VH2]